MNNEDNIRKIIDLKTRRLQKLKEQEARNGTNVDPSISIQIEDLEVEIKILKREIHSAPQGGESAVQVIIKGDGEWDDEPYPDPYSVSKNNGLMEVRGQIINPWRSGSFYLVSFILGFIAYFLVRAYKLSGYDVVAAFGVGITAMLVIGIFQLRNDGRLSETSFTTLVIELFKRFPFFRKSQKD